MDIFGHEDINWINAFILTCLPPLSNLHNTIVIFPLSFKRLEAAKRLQLGRLRLEMLKFELNRLKRGRGSPQSQLMVNPKSSKKALARPSYAGVSLSDIRIPLMWRRKVRRNVTCCTTPPPPTPVCLTALLTLRNTSLYFFSFILHLIFWWTF